MTEVEIAVEGAAGARVALEAGADRLELCMALHSVGGLTPTVGLAGEVVAVGLPTFALIRNRPGGFIYSAADLAVMEADIKALDQAGVAGFVIGAATPDGGLDLPALDRLIRAAPGKEFVLHRVFDILTDREKALEQLAGRVTRVLTSGGRPTAPEGAAEIYRLQEKAPGIELMAGGGIKPSTVEALKGVRSVHGSAAAELRQYGPTGPGGRGEAVMDTDPQQVKALVQAVKAWNNSPCG
ncbi:hypothetical protein CPHO_02345 [Corynebacterium phocae]|uniref:PF03932 family protein CutC n=1 Tax=Corynebacterium phocae TaxID=161895 RepID=A0A1L7D1C0_9CORY|nr:copper homeostasis protein CutC [Corynebacterium phocae]APT91939.1 hypothetical protein CPHO_02345 [Corynebacterium phocae]KAA8726924.1 copper homeostasis protein CutC [Corynebacterium phocae]